MRHILALFAAIALLFAAVGSAQAVDLRNEGFEPVQVEVTSPSVTKIVKLQPRTLAIVICVGKCTFEAPGMGRVEAGGSDVVAVRDGTLSRRAAPTTISAR